MDMDQQRIMEAYHEQVPAMVTNSVAKVLCCLCGILIDSNPSNMCANCLRSQVDITEGIPKQCVVYFCKFCDRYHVPPKAWVHAELESKELLSLLVKRLRGLNKVKLVDAGFKWTEPHSRRIIVRLAIQKEVFANTVLQQEFLVEYLVEMLQCDGCKREAANMDAWQAVVQLRQKIDHKRTFMYLEQVILKHNAHEDALGMKEMPDGLDFYFLTKSNALKFISFVNSIVPLRHKLSEHLMSQDYNNNTVRYKYSFMAEISPLCRDDLVVLPPKVSGHLGGIGPLVLVTKVSQSVTFLDIKNFRSADLVSSYYWKNEFGALLGSRRLTEFTVLDSEPTGERIGKHVITDLTVCRSSDLGNNDKVFYVRSHLGHMLHSGDLCLGYDISSQNFNEADVDRHKKKLDLPDVVLVRKTYPKRNRSRGRTWKLKSLAVEQDESMMGVSKPKASSGHELDEREQFYQELEQDPELRAAVNLYKDEKAIENVTRNKEIKNTMRDEGEDEGTHGDEDDDEAENDEYPEIPITELLDGLHLGDQPGEPEGTEAEPPQEELPPTLPTV
eukprot:CAMPEP_0184691942 /NCGR_PEP_ID=MMETSP0313-20130426/623_1 /TAXON_ID=2792 /ORGANISM="Porphyridium aerugineum, Strain SAG 1380-2" /LENGTH=556 /DNA_ID=CAMNT_0027149725 /DNA_START=168 /DNA_END=1838 /DNA_ORIENTATION=+